MLSQEPTPSIVEKQCNSYTWLSQRAWVEIDISALRHNMQELRNFVPLSTELMAVVKADAYGHGAVTVAQTVLQSGASWLGVATVPEGIQLREAGIKAPILILGATYTPEQIQALAQWNLQPTLCSPRQALVFSSTLETHQSNSLLPVHIKLDTGMSRVGTNWENAGEFVQLVHRLPHLKIKSVYSHLATADDPDPTIMRLQHSRFEKAIAQIKSLGINPPCLHLANSAGTLSDNALHYDLVRPGLAIYGLSPAPHLQKVVNFKPVLQVKARVTQIKNIAAGTGVSYGHKFIAKEAMKIAVVGIGYADGVPRNLSNKIQVLIGGQRVSQIGTITMDQLMLDITEISDIQEGEIVTLLGSQGNEQIYADDWAEKLNTISWEILCGFKHRLPRVAISH
jgi:alanine racemase